MYQLRALVWKAYRVRLRSPLSSALDIFGPIAIIIIYIIMKALLGSFSSQIDEVTNSIPLFRNFQTKPMDPIGKLQHHMCPKVLFYSKDSTGSLLHQTIKSQCNIDLINVSGRDDLIEKLEASLSARIAHKTTANTNLNKSNSTSGCSLPGLQEPNYQAGLVYSSQSNAMEVFLTDSVGHSVIYQPWSQGSTYNEFRFPQSDLNSGFHMLEICITEALRANGGFRPPLQPSQANSSIVNNSTLPPTNSNNLRWRFESFPIIVAPSTFTAIFLLFLLTGFLCNAICTMMRVCDDNENGFRHYVRASGVSATVYYSAHILIIFIHMLVQCLIIAILLAIPTSENLLDPASEANITLRFLLIFTYGLALNIHAMFIGSLFNRSSIGILVACFLAVAYAMYAIFFFVQWNPYRFAPFGQLVLFLILNPVSNFQAIILTLTAIYLQTGEPLNWSQLNMSIVGGGLNDLSLSTLWLLLFAHILFWYLATIFVDQILYKSTNNPVYLAMNIANEALCCNSLLPFNEKTITTSVHSKSSAKTPTNRDPNRLCCSLRGVSVVGPSVSVAQTKGDALKLSPDQLKRFDDLSKDQARHLSHQVNSAKSPQPNKKHDIIREVPILLDDSLQQNIVWSETQIQLHHIDVDFRFNQVSFVLGQTNLKELFFAALMGLRPLRSGYIILDSVRYSSRSLHHARAHIGYLGEKDIFLNEMNIHENLQFFGSLRDPSYTNFESESNFLLSLLHLSSKRASLPVTLTSRSARKLSLAVAAVGHTKLLLLVEPTLGLRWRPRCQVLNLLKKYKSIRSIVVDTSDVDEAVAVGDKVVLLKDGFVILDGSPGKLLRKLQCGYWLVFEPVVGSNKDTLHSSLAELETLITKIFKQDKIENLDVTNRSVYEQLMTTGSHETATPAGVKSPVVRPMPKLEYERPYKPTVIGKVRHSEYTNQAICSILNMFSQQNLHGFRLTELTYESLEDILVFRMARAHYPDLPPDLLLALQHRIQGDVDAQQVSSTRRRLSDVDVPKTVKPIFKASVLAIIKDRFRVPRELLIVFLAFLFSLVWVGVSLWALQISLQMDPPNSSPVALRSNATKVFHENMVEFRQVDQLFNTRIGLYIIENADSNTKNGTNSSSFNSYLSSWPGNKNFAGTVRRSMNTSDAEFVNNLVQKSKDSISSVIFYDPQASEATIVIEPHFPHAMIAGIKYFMAYKNSLATNIRQGSSATSVVKSSSVSLQDQLLQSVAQPVQTSTFKRTFQQPWHEIIQGHTNRRLFYGIGFAVAEGIAIGSLVITPLRHRVESRVVDMSNTYWFAMAIVDITISMISALGYTLLIIILDGLHSISLILCVALILFLYKLASIPVAYLVSLVAETSFSGFTFILLFYTTIAWTFSINLKSWVEWTIFNVGYLYTITSWVIHAMPISSLIDGLHDISQINRMNDLCGQVPAYMATTNIVDLEGPQAYTIMDSIFDKLRECLANGKNGISTNVMNQGEFGILWDIGLIVLFGIIAWIFLLSSERLFGILARRFNSNRTSSDLMKTVIRSSQQPSTSAFKWNREKDRLVSEYVRCVNEVKYVKHLATNCVYLRIWLRPMSDQSSLGKNISLMIEPLINLGLNKNEIRVELKTTLQIFIRIGNESARCKIGKVQLIETYAKFLKQHNDMLLKFAVVDWTREMLYKILLHGHYNTKSTHNNPQVI